MFCREPFGDSSVYIHTMFSFFLDNFSFARNETAKPLKDCEMKHESESNKVKRDRELSETGGTMDHGGDALGVVAREREKGGINNLFSIKHHPDQSSWPCRNN